MPRSQIEVVIALQMASQEFHKLFQNASEGQEEGQIQGNLPEWMNTDNLIVIYNGPVSIYLYQLGNVLVPTDKTRCYVNSN